MKIVIIGSNGQLGGHLMQEFADCNPIGLTHTQFEILEQGDIKAMLDAYKPDWVITTASYNRVDEIESQPDRALMVNGVGANYLSKACYSANAGLVYYSTDYVFGGEKNEPYNETDRPQPLNVYGLSKFVGEQFVSMYAGRFMVIRVSSLYGGGGSRSKGGNFVTTMLRLAEKRDPIRVVNDQTFSISPCDEVAERTKALIKKGGSGIYHLVGRGKTTWYEFAKKIFEIAGLKPDLIPTTTEEWNATARRPQYSALANNHAVALGVPELSEWEASLEKYIKTLLTG